MKVLKIESKKAFYSIDGTNYKPIVDIAKEDIYTMLNIIYTTDDYEMDKCDDSNEIVNDVEKLIYNNIYIQLNTFIQNKLNLVSEINNLLNDVREKYQKETEE